MTLPFPSVGQFLTKGDSIEAHGLVSSRQSRMSRFSGSVFSAASAASSAANIPSAANAGSAAAPASETRVNDIRRFSNAIQKADDRLDGFDHGREYTVGGCDHGCDTHN